MKNISSRLIIISILLIAAINEIKAQHVTATSINLNSRSQYGGDYPTDNGNYQNVLSIGGVGAESGLKIYKQDRASPHLLLEVTIIMMLTFLK